MPLEIDEQRNLRGRIEPLVGKSRQQDPQRVFRRSAVAGAIDRRIPGALVAIVVAIALAASMGLRGRGIPMVGNLPRGLPVPNWPPYDGNFPIPAEFAPAPAAAPGRGASK